MSGDATKCAFFQVATSKGTSMQSISVYRYIIQYKMLQLVSPLFNCSTSMSHSRLPHSSRGRQYLQEYHIPGAIL